MIKHLKYALAASVLVSMSYYSTAASKPRSTDGSEKVAPGDSSNDSEGNKKIEIPKELHSDDSKKSESDNDRATLSIPRTLNETKKDGRKSN